MSWRFTTEGDPVPLTKDELEHIVPNIEITERDAPAPVQIEMKDVNKVHKTMNCPLQSTEGKERQVCSAGEHMWADPQTSQSRIFHDLFTRNDVQLSSH